MIINNESAEKLVDHLLQIKAIKLQPGNPFTWASGILSPIYCDNRIILSYPKVRTFVREEIVSLIKQGDDLPDVIVGVATGGIAIGALAAQELGLPFAYVRSSGKGHGMKNQIEGVVSKGQTVLVIEDLISSGGSSLKAVEVLREAGCNVYDMIAIFTYEFDIAKKAFEKMDVNLTTLSNYSTLLKRASRTNYIKSEELEHLNQWRENPSQWKKS